MAVLAAYDMADLCPWRSLQVYTVGAPRPGNQAFAAKYEAKVPATWHIINPKVRIREAACRDSDITTLATLNMHVTPFLSSLQWVLQEFASMHDLLAR